METHNEIPRKILHIRDLTFILPDDFEGTIDDAMAEFLKYRRGIREHDVHYIDDGGIFSTAGLLLNSGKTDTVRVCGEYGLFEFRDGAYVLLDGSVPTVIRATSESKEDTKKQ